MPSPPEADFCRQN